MSESGRRPTRGNFIIGPLPLHTDPPMNNFQLVGLSNQAFARLFDLSDEELRALGIKRRVADESPGFPCRISLQEAAIGEELLLLPHVHHDVDSPYRASGPIFIRRGAQQAVLPPGEVPEVVTRRLMSARAYDNQHLMLSADVCEGVHAAATLQRLLADDRVAYIQLHNARQGCFSCQVNRV